MTILFADVSGFTSMSERLDPEDVHAIMNDCFAGLGGAIDREGGHIDKYIGDCIMALFGAPIAHEDDPARACRAALDMQSFLSRFAEEHMAKAGVALRMRIGIGCGMVLAGGVGSETRKDYSVMGDTVNLASRLESAARPGSILVSGEVVRRTRGMFEFASPQLLQVKGKEQPVEAAELLREVTRVSPRGRDGLSIELIGRQPEIEELSSRLERGENWIEVRGEMGIGKTRLVEETTRRVGFRLLPIVSTSDVALRPFGLIERLIKVAIQEVAGLKDFPETRDAFAAAVAPVGEGLEPYVDVLWWMGARSRLAARAPESDPQTLRRLLKQGVVGLLRGLGREAPDLVLLLDSYELCDDDSADLLESLGARPGGWDNRFIVTTRDEGRAPLAQQAVVRLLRLSESGAGTLLDRLVRGADLPQDLRGNLIQRSAGIPLHLEEMVRGLVDDGVLQPVEGTSTWSFRPGAAAISLPASIRSAMLCRLDRLETSPRELLCQCAVQGVEFNANIAHALRPSQTADSVQRELSDLRALGFVEQVGVTGNADWSFRHPLMQEACYETLLKRERRALHGAIGDALCVPAGGADRVPALVLARHFEHAERWGEAGHAYQRAGTDSERLFVNRGALEAFDRARQMLAHLSQPSAEESRLAALVEASAARVHLRIGEYADALECTERMQDLTTVPEDVAEMCRLSALAHMHTGRTEQAEAQLRRAVELAPRGDRNCDVLVQVLCDLSDLLLQANRLDEASEFLGECRDQKCFGEGPISIRADMLEGKIAHTRGSYGEALALYEQAYDTAERIGSLAELAGAANSMGTAARDRGDYAAAERHQSRALELYKRIGDPAGVEFARNNLGNLAMSRGDLETARVHLEGARVAARELGHVRGQAGAGANLAILAIERGDGTGAVAAAEAAIALLGGSQHEMLRRQIIVVLAEGYLACRDANGARSVLCRLVGDEIESQPVLVQAGAMRGLGRAALLEGALDEALDNLSRALELYELLTREQEAARTRLYLAEALARAGDVERACAEVARARASFVSMNAERDIARADDLLADLPPTPAS